MGVGVGSAVPKVNTKGNQRKGPFFRLGCNYCSDLAVLLPLAAASYCPSVDGLRFVGLIGQSRHPLIAHCFGLVDLFETILDLDMSMQQCMLVARVI